MACRVFGDLEKGNGKAGQGVKAEAVKDELEGFTRRLCSSTRPNGYPIIDI
jgi:hypothetical protein